MPRSILQRVVVDEQPSGIYIRRGYFITQGYHSNSLRIATYLKKKRRRRFKYQFPILYLIV